MTQPVYWPYREDQTCLAKIHPGNANMPTPQVLSYGNGLMITKAKHPHDPLQGWHRINKEAYEILSQETDSSSGVCLIAFREDPMTERQVEMRRASKRSQAQASVGLDQMTLKTAVREALVEAGIIAELPPEEAAEVLATEDPEAETEELAEGLGTAASDDDSDPEEKSRPSRRRTKKKAAKKKRGGRLRLSGK